MIFYDLISLLGVHLGFKICP